MTDIGQTVELLVFELGICRSKERWRDGGETEQMGRESEVTQSIYLFVCLSFLNRGFLNCGTRISNDSANQNANQF